VPIESPRVAHRLVRILGECDHRRHQEGGRTPEQLPDTTENQCTGRQRPEKHPSQVESPAQQGKGDEGAHHGPGIVQGTVKAEGHTALSFRRAGSDQGIAG
jgi:hypothetical protein